ncbi:MAG: hypothetical protein AB7S38_15350 [Vulcanimicrobiota bacterium]
MTVNVDRYLLEALDLVQAGRKRQAAEVLDLVAVICRSCGEEEEAQDYEALARWARAEGEDDDGTTAPRRPRLPSAGGAAALTLPIEGAPAPDLLGTRHPGRVTRL